MPTISVSVLASILHFRFDAFGLLRAFYTPQVLVNILSHLSRRGTLRMLDNRLSVFLITVTNSFPVQP